MTELLLFLFGAMAISFMCSILESVLMSTPISFITMKEEEGFKYASTFRKYKEEAGRPIAAILSLNTIANTVGAAGVGRQATMVFGSEWFGLVSAITTILILVFSEIVPKTIGTSYWKGLMGITTRMISFLIVIMFPLVVIVEQLSKFLSKKDEDEPEVSREEVSAMANVGEEEGVIDEDENKIIQNIIKLDNVKAFEVMTPRVVSSVAPESMTLKDFYKVKAFEYHSRIPVFAESPEYITGYILRSDALEALADDKFDMTLNDIKRPVTFFNEERPISDIWDELLARREQISVIIDEYGAFQGILTLEDIIETIFGLEITDENDEAVDMQQLARERWERRQRNYKEIELPE